MLGGTMDSLSTHYPHFHLTGIAEPFYNVFPQQKPSNCKDIFQDRDLRRVGDMTPLKHTENIFL